MGSRKTVAFLGRKDLVFTNFLGACERLCITGVWLLSEL